MTRQDFELIARILRETGKNADHEQAQLHHDHVIEEFARALGMEHPNFDEGRFLNAAHGRD